MTNWQRLIRKKTCYYLNSFQFTEVKEVKKIELQKKKKRSSQAHVRDSVVRGTHSTAMVQKYSSTQYTYALVLLLVLYIHIVHYGSPWSYRYIYSTHRKYNVIINKKTEEEEKK